VVVGSNGAVSGLLVGDGVACVYRNRNTYGRRAFSIAARRSGTRCPTISEIRRVVLTVLSSFLRQSCLVFTNVTSALEVFLNVMRYINPRFTYLLTLLTYCRA